MRILLSFAALFSVSVLFGCGGGDSDAVEETDVDNVELTEEEEAEEMELQSESE